MAEDPLNTLVAILRDRDLPYDRDALKSAYNDAENQTAIREWIQEYLSPETLLTKDEANLYAALSKTGEADALAAQDLSLIQGLNEQEIQNAIEELKRSTAAIEKQSEALRLQQNAMNALVKNDKKAVQARSHTENAQVRKWDVEKGHIDSAIEELSGSLKYQILDLEQQFKSSETGVKQTVDDILKSDDKLLLSLQKLASDLDPGRPEDGDMITSIRELCASLIKHTVEGIRTKLDRIYLEALNNLSHGPEPEEQEVRELQEELESLYSEILPVAQMSVQQQYLEPALRTIAASNGEGEERTVKAVKYINDCMVFLVDRIETFLKRVEESQCHYMALQFVVGSAKKELSQPENESPTKDSSPVKPNTQRRRKSSSSLSLVRTRRRSSGKLLDEDIEPEQQLARNLGIALPAEAVTDEARIDILERALFDRISKLESHAASLQSTIESSISSHLLDAHMTLELLHDSLLAESLYHKVRLLDPSIESSVATFEKDVQDLQKNLEAVDLHTLQSRNVHKEQLTKRWSR